MSKSLKAITLTVGALVGLLVLAAISLFLFLDVNALKPRLEAAASDITGMEVRVGGRLGIGFFPGVLVTLEDVRMRNRGTDVATAKAAKIGVDLLPLLHKEVRIKTIALEHPSLSIEKGRDGKFNFEKSEAVRRPSPRLNLAKVSFSDGTLRYADR